MLTLCVPSIPCCLPACLAPCVCCRVPPKLRLVAARPIVLDAALNYIKYPSLEHRLPQKAPQQQGAAGGSMVSRLFGWGR